MRLAVAAATPATPAAMPAAVAARSLRERILQQPDLAGLVAQSRHIGLLQQSMAVSGCNAAEATPLLTSLFDALAQRLLVLTEARLGPAPLPWLWMAAGSQARGEQSAHTDQDNALLLDDSFEESRHGDYFRQLAQAVCDGLHACGQVHCPGEVMASNPQWRQPLRCWQRTFHDWIAAPDRMALMLSSLFFDLRGVAGEAALLHELQREVRALARGNGIFLAHLAANALVNPVALNLLGWLRPQRGAHAGCIDLKKNGLLPIVDLARVYTLASGGDAVATCSRLRQVDPALLSVSGAADLAEAWNQLATLRLRHQAQQLARGQHPDNHLPLKALSRPERRRLRASLRVVAVQQRVLRQRWLAEWW